MKSRMAITMMLVLGIMLSTAGGGLAVQGIGDDAGSAQYPPENPRINQPLQPRVTVQPEAPAEDQPRNQVLAEQEDQAAPERAAAQAPRQIAQAPRQVAAAAGEEQLPFTGLAAIPVLLAGLALLVTGAALRRRTRP